jgi:hypothetical protein
MMATTVALVGCAMAVALTPGVAVPHPAYAPGTSCDAADCHTDYKHKEPYLGACDLCHNTEDWSRATYAHKNKRFDNGMHPLVGCEKCHTEGEATQARGCATCHTPPHQGWESCGSCHTTFAWRMFNALPEGHLSLEGGHAKLVCLDCHTAKTEPETPRQCVACHGTNHGGLTTCQDCHSPATGWNPKPGWSHTDFFTLKGIHKTLECAQCHKNGVFPGTPKVCVGCHGKQHGGLTDCGGCHNTSAFKPPTFKHSSVFTLSGAHTQLKCTKCHPGRAFASTISHGGTACGSCHPPQHGGLTKCGDCHVTSGFNGASKFHHSDYFKLVGPHTSLKCAKCHHDGKFAIMNFSNDSGHWKCVDCHGVNHGNQTQCTNCHQATSWTDTLPIEHPAENVPLGPKHAWRNPCTRCHIDNVFDTPTRACNAEGCHTPPHVGPSDCRSCHTPTQWSDAHFTHPVIPNWDNTAPSGHGYTDFGGYPEGCSKCHTSAGPDFTTYSCTAAACGHQ